VTVTSSDGELARLTELVEWQRQEMSRMRSGAAARSVTDVAIGILMERLSCSAADAEKQLDRLSVEAHVSQVEVASEIAEVPAPDTAPGARPDPAWLGQARATARTEQDGAGVARAVLEEALSDEGASAVAIWLFAPDGALELAGEAGFGAQEASRWQRIPPGFDVPAQRAARDDTEFWWPKGRPTDTDLPLMGGNARCARAVLPLRRLGANIGALEVCWPTVVPGISPLTRSRLASLAEVCAQALSAGGAGGIASDYSAAWIYALLDGLHESALIARACHNDRGQAVGLVIDWVSQRFADPVRRQRTEVVGRKLIEIYPEAVRSGGLYDRAMHVLATGQPQHLDGVVLTRAAGGFIAEVDIAPLFDGLVISWRETSDTQRLTALLEQAQWLGRIGSWQEDYISGEVHWTDHAFTVLGRSTGSPVPLANLDEHVHAEDRPAVAAFRERLLGSKEGATAAFRIIRDDDGSVRQIRAFGQAVVSPTGTLIAVRGAYQDISTQFYTQVAFDVAREQLLSAEERASEQHRLAVQLQEAITPHASRLVEDAGLEVTARYRPAGPASLVSGDWYDAVGLPAKGVLLAVGDVAGHGLNAVTGMVALRNYLRGLAVTGAGPAELLGWLNTAACDLTDGIFATAICAIYDPADRTLRWAQAGHLPPLLIRRGSAQMLQPPAGLLLGADTEFQYAEASTNLQVGDVLLLFTDGLIEQRGVPIDDSLADLTERASQWEPDRGGLADEILANSLSDTGDDACLLAISIR
jgi:Stage II sporulation protein E (SpoIIE)/ANTAR domain